MTKPHNLGGLCKLMSRPRPSRTIAAPLSPTCWLQQHQQPPPSTQNPQSFRPEGNGSRGSSSHSVILKSTHVTSTSARGWDSHMVPAHWQGGLETRTSNCLCPDPPNHAPPSSLHGEHRPRPVQHGLQLRAGVSGDEKWLHLVAPLTPEPRELKQWVIYPLHTLEMHMSDNKSKGPSGAH